MMCLTRDIRDVDPGRHANSYGPVAPAYAKSLPLGHAPASRSGSPQGPCATVATRLRTCCLPPSIDSTSSRRCALSDCSRDVTLCTSDAKSLEHPPLSGLRPSGVQLVPCALKPCGAPAAGRKPARTPKSAVRDRCPQGSRRRLNGARLSSAWILPFVNRVHRSRRRKSTAVRGAVTLL